MFDIIVFYSKCRLVPFHDIITNYRKCPTPKTNYVKQSDFTNVTHYLFISYAIYCFQ